MQSTGTVVHEVPTVSVHCHQLPGHCIQQRRQGARHATVKPMSQRPKHSGGKRRNSCYRRRACSQRVVQASAHNGADMAGITGMMSYVTYSVEENAASPSVLHFMQALIYAI